MATPAEPPPRPEPEPLLGPPPREPAAGPSRAPGNAARKALSTVRRAGYRGDYMPDAERYKPGAYEAWLEGVEARRVALVAGLWYPGRGSVPPPSVREACRRATWALYHARRVYGEWLVAEVRRAEAALAAHRGSPRAFGLPGDVASIRRRAKRAMALV